MTTKRTNRVNQKKWLSSKKNLKILDLGCSNNNFWKEANHFADIHDFKSDFKRLNLNFTQIKPDERLPFNDKEFDYVICSHVLEHVNDPVFLKNEIERIGKSGYLELPTKLSDNLVFGCDEEVFGHKWWFEFDDDENKLIYAKKIDAIEKFISVGTTYSLNENFDDSFTIQIFWTDNINLEQREQYNLKKKITFLSLIKKYFSKKIRVQFSKIKNILR